MALDYGEVRIGIAFSDLMQIVASPYETYTRKSVDEDIKYLANLTKTQQVSVLVVGLPINMDGTEGDRAQKTREFANALKQHISQNIELVFVDERLSSVEAEEMLIQAKVRRDKRKMVIDKVAASIILQGYLNSK